MIHQGRVDTRPFAFFRTAIWCSESSDNAGVHPAPDEQLRPTPRMSGYRPAHQDGRPRTNGLQWIQAETAYGDTACANGQPIRVRTLVLTTEHLLSAPCNSALVA